MRDTITIRCSSLQRVALCPGSVRAEQGLPETTSPDAERGTRIHAWLAAHFAQLPTPHLEDEELYAAQYLAGRAQTLFDAHGGLDVDRSIFEQEFSCGFLSGHPDLVAECKDNTTHVIDWKTGFGEVPDASRNAQLRGYVVLYAVDCGFSGEIFAHIISPTGITSTFYNLADITLARNELAVIATAANAQDAKRIPAPDACRYCRAFGNQERCPESCAMLPTAANTLPAEVRDVESLPAAKVATLLEQAALVEKLIDVVRDEAKRRLQADGNSVPGWTLKDGATRRTLTDAAAAYARLHDVPESVLFSAAKISLPELEKAVNALQKERGHKQTKEQVRAWLEDRLTGLIVEKQDAPSLKRKE